jgi:hypothetical protein
MLTLCLSHDYETLNAAQHKYNGVGQAGEGVVQAPLAEPKLRDAEPPHSL